MTPGSERLRPRPSPVERASRISSSSDGGIAICLGNDAALIPRGGGDSARGLCLTTDTPKGAEFGGPPGVHLALRYWGGSTQPRVPGGLLLQGQAQDALARGDGPATADEAGQRGDALRGVRAPTREHRAATARSTAVDEQGGPRACGLGVRAVADARELGASAGLQAPHADEGGLGGGVRHPGLRDAQ